MCPESFRKKIEFYDRKNLKKPREPRPSWGNKIHFCRFLPFLPSAGAMTAATTAPSGHASAVQPPGRHVERRAWSWSGPLHLPWPSEHSKWPKCGRIFCLRRPCGGSAGVMTGTQNTTSGTKKTAQHPRENIESIMHFGGLETGSKWTIPF